jgi:hypothetical protein
MAKVIDMFTGQDITDRPLPLTKEQGEQLIMDLFELELKRASNPFSATAEIVAAMISMVENNSGASRYEVMDRFYNSRSV